MPYIRIDEDGMEDDDETGVTFTGDFSYHTVEEYAYKPQAFDPAELTGPVATVYAMLRSIGLIEFHVRYDGGHDEGFAHADGGRSADGTLRSIESIVDDLATPDNVSALGKAFSAVADRRHHSVREYYAKLTPSDFVKQMLDELADAMAGCLLGKGYGTGEYSIYGAFTADLTTGSLIDDANAQRPPDVSFD